MLLDLHVVFSDEHAPDTRQDLIGIFTEKPQSGEVTVGEWLHKNSNDYELSWKKLQIRFEFL